MPYKVENILAREVKFENILAPNWRVEPRTCFILVVAGTIVVFKNLLSTFRSPVLRVYVMRKYSPTSICIYTFRYRYYQYDRQGRHYFYSPERQSSCVTRLLYIYWLIFWRVPFVLTSCLSYSILL